MRLGEREPGEHIALKVLTHFVEKKISAFLSLQIVISF